MLDHAPLAIRGNAPWERGSTIPLRPRRFSTDAFDSRHRFDAWCTEFGGLNDIVLPREERAKFEARFAAWTLGAFTVTASTTPAMRMIRGPRHAARDGLDHWVLRVARNGTVRTRLGDARHETPPRQLMLYSVAGGFEGDWSAAEWVTLWIRRDAFPRIDADLSVRPAGPQPGVTAALLADMLLSLPDHLTQAGAADEPAIVEAIRAMVTGSLLGAGAAPRPAMPSEDRAALVGNPLLRERVTRVIQTNIHSPRLTPDRIARAAGISRTALYRMLEPEGGVARHVQRVRLSAIHAALADPACATRPIAALAAEHGFHDASAFGRIFRRVYGCTPGDHRAASQASLRSTPMELLSPSPTSSADRTT